MTSRDNFTYTLLIYKMDFNKELFETLLYSTISVVTKNSEEKKVLIDQIYNLLGNKFEQLSNSAIDFSDESLIKKYDSMSALYQNYYKSSMNEESDGNVSEESDEFLNSGYEISSQLKTLHNMVIDYASQGRYEVAIPLCKQTLEDIKKTNEHNKSDVANISEMLGVIYLDQNDYNEAENYLKEALTIKEKVFGYNYKSVILTKNNLANAYFQQNRYQESERLYKQVLDTVHENEIGFINGENECIWELAEELQKLGNKNSFLVSNEYREWHKFFNKYPTLSITLQNLGAIYRRKSMTIAAEILEETALKTKSMSKNSENTFYSRIGYRERRLSNGYRRESFGVIKDSIGIQTEDAINQTDNLDLEESDDLIDKNEPNFRFKLMKSLGIEAKTP
jgi:tetratricopeptide (TPR) repeat protein